MIGFAEDVMFNPDAVKHVFGIGQTTWIVADEWRLVQSSTE